MTFGDAYAVDPAYEVLHNFETDRCPDGPSRFVPADVADEMVLAGSSRRCEQCWPPEPIAEAPEQNRAVKTAQWGDLQAWD